MKKPAFISGLLMMVLGLGLAVAVLYFLPHCHTPKPMRCFWMVRATALMGFYVGVAGVMLQWAGRQVAVGIELMNVLAGLVIVALATFVIGPCPNPMMGCHTTTQNVVILWGVMITLAGAADAWRLSRA